MIDFQVVKQVQKMWHRPLFASTIFFVCAFVIFSTIFLLSDGDPVPDDAYFHFRYAQELCTDWSRAVAHFDWIYLSGHSVEGGSRYGVSLYQISLIPFTFISDQIMGLQMAIACYLSGAFALLYYVLRKEKVAYPLFFTILVMTSTYLMARFLLGRAFVLVPFIMLLEMHFAIRRKYLPLFCVVFFHAVWHQATYFLPVITIVVVEIARYLALHKWQYQTMIATAGGVVTSMLFFPGFPMNVISWLREIIFVQARDPQAASGSLGGVEMATKDFMTYIVGQEMVFLMCVVSIGGAIYWYVLQKKGVHFTSVTQERQVWVYALFMLFVAFVYGATMISGRFFDFVLPTLGAFFAFVFTLICDMRVVTVQQQFGVWMRGVAVAWLVIVCAHMLIFVYAKSNTYDHMPAGQAAQWIFENSDGREKVYLHNWGNFSLMFFANTHNVYSTGIEPATLKKYDPVLFWKYYNIFAHNFYCEQLRDCGDVVMQQETQLARMDDAIKEKVLKKNSEAVINAIKHDFDATFIVSDAEEFDRLILASPELIASYQEFTSEEFDGAHMRFMVFKLR